ncbi:MAG: hypothetical protein AB8B50_11510 [Pirellulaceae bacterium]
MAEMTDSQFSDGQFSDLQLSETESSDAFTRVSKLAIVSLVLSLVTSITVLAPSLNFFAVVVAVLALIAYVRISGDAQLGGEWIAITALAISVTAGCWSWTADQKRTQYLYSVAGEHASSYLGLLSAGKAYEAMELRKPEVDRQITGTALKNVYGGSESQAAEAMEKMLDRPETKLVLEQGADADWQMVRGVGVGHSNKFSQIMIEMQNRNADDDVILHVTLRRNAGGVIDDESTALWHVLEHFFP